MGVRRDKGELSHDEEDGKEAKVRKKITECEEKRVRQR